MLQDKPFPEAKKVIMVNELGTGVLPFTAVIQGIKSLHAEDLRSIKLFLLIEAIRKFVDSDTNRFNCAHCHKEGCVTMIDEEGHMFALACVCSNGDIIENLQGLVRWTGKGVQGSNGRVLFRSHAARNEPLVDETPAPVDNELKDLLAAVGGTIVDEGVKQ